ncbi:MAG TPA: cupin domain-containing protein [Rhizomicrobium sp.]|nr:cupin domain-containing protein [Rhizomicrobium sp.]
MDEAARIIRHLNLAPHPEGGHYREIFRDAHSTAIYFLLRDGEVSHWHRIESAETWHWYRGSALELRIENTMRHVLGNDLEAGQHPQITVPPRAWQSARSLGAFTLVGCTVAPGFEFSQFELAPRGFEP